MAIKDEVPAATGVSYRVLKAGDGKIYTGLHSTDDEGQITFTTYAKGDQVDGVDAKIAGDLEDRGLVEVLG